MDTLQSLALWGRFEGLDALGPVNMLDPWGSGEALVSLDTLPHHTVLEIF